MLANLLTMTKPITHYPLMEAEFLGLGNFEDKAFSAIPNKLGYVACSNGEIISMSYNRHIGKGNFAWQKGKRLKATHRKNSHGGNGYMVVSLSGDKQRVHKLISKAYYLPRSCDEANQVDHIDEDSLNNRLSNLQWLTPKENTVKHYKRKA